MLGFLSNIVMLGMGVWFIWRGEFTIGGLIACRGYWWRFAKSHQHAGTNDRHAAAGKTAASRVVEVLDTPVDIADLPQAVPLRSGMGEIVFEDVALRYKSGPPVLNGVDFRIASGECRRDCRNERRWKNHIDQSFAEIFRSLGGKDSYRRPGDSEGKA